MVYRRQLHVLQTRKKRVKNLFLMVLLLWTARLNLAAAPSDDIPGTLREAAIVNERLNYALQLDNGIIVVISCHRLFTCTQTNILGPLDTYWRQVNLTTIPAFYKNSVYLTEQMTGRMDAFSVRRDGRISKTATLNTGPGFRSPVVWNDKLYDVGSTQMGSTRADLFVYSLEKPGQPSLLHRISLPDKFTSVPRGIHLTEDRLFCFTAKKLYACEMKGSGQVEILSELAFDTGRSFLGGVAFSDANAYAYTGRKISTFDISSPRQIKELRTQPATLRYTMGGNDKGFFSFANGDLSEFVYAANRIDGVRAVRLDGNKGVCFVPGPNGGFTIDKDGALTERSFGEPRARTRVLGVEGQSTLVAANDHLYVMGNALQVYDITSPPNIKEIARNPDIRIPRSECKPIFRDGLIYAADCVIDVNEPASPRIVEKYKRCDSLSIAGSLLYRLSGNSYSAWRIRKNQRMRHLYSGHLSGVSSARHMHLTTNSVFLAVDNKAIAAYGISKDYSLEPISRLDLPGEHTHIHDVTSDGDVMYVALGIGGTVSLDISDIEKMNVRSKNRERGGLRLAGFAEKAFVGNGYHASSVTIFEMNKSHRTRILSGCRTGSKPVGLDVYKGHVYALTEQSGLLVLHCNELNKNEPGDIDAYDNSPRLSPDEIRSIDAIIEALGSPASRDRDSAQETLAAKLPDEALLLHLEERLKNSDDPEIRFRLQNVME